MEEIIIKIENWLKGPRDYSEGRKLLKTIQNEHMSYLQTTETETYESRLRIYRAFNNTIARFKEDHN